MFLEESFIKRKIKGNINETIVEFMFRDLGFYVIKLGQEHKVEPIVQLEDFINQFKFQFRIFSKSKFTDGFEEIRTLPDFLIVKNNFRPVLIEAKYRSTGIYFNNLKTHPKLERLFNFYPNSFLLLTCKNLYTSKNKFNSIFINSDYDTLLKTKFHIIYKDNKSNCFVCVSFYDWVCDYFKITSLLYKKKMALIIKKYENLVNFYL